MLQLVSSSKFKVHIFPYHDFNLFFSRCYIYMITLRHIKMDSVKSVLYACICSTGYQGLLLKTNCESGAKID